MSITYLYTINICRPMLNCAVKAERRSAEGYDVANHMIFRNAEPFKGFRQKISDGPFSQAVPDRTDTHTLGKQFKI